MIIIRDQLAHIQYMPLDRLFHLIRQSFLERCINPLMLAKGAFIAARQQNRAKMNTQQLRANDINHMNGLLIAASLIDDAVKLFIRLRIFLITLFLKQ